MNLHLGIYLLPINLCFLFCSHAFFSSLSALISFIHFPPPSSIFLGIFLCSLKCFNTIFIFFYPSLPVILIHLYTAILGSFCIFITSFFHSSLNTNISILFVPLLTPFRISNAKLRSKGTVEEGEGAEGGDVN